MQLNTLQTLGFLETSGVGRKTVARIQGMQCPRPEDPESMQATLERLKKEHPYTRVPNIEQIENGIEAAHSILDKCRKSEINIAIPGDKVFPPLLLNIPERPVLLYFRGSESCLSSTQAAAVVGTRSPSSFGRACGRRIAEIFGSHDITVVSGLALGCDTAAHQGCLEADGQTLAFLAHGLDHIYPKKNEQLARDILDSGGCLVSEHPPGTRPRNNYFVERNRLQSGFSRGTVVVETGVEGGTMHTARFTIEQSRLLACLRHPPDKRGDHTEGNELLIRTEGAFELGSDGELNRFIQEIRECSPKPGSETEHRNS